MLSAVAVHAQPGDAVAPAGLAPLSDVPVLKVAAVDAGARAAEAGPGAPGEPYRFADPFAVDVTPDTHGRWETTDEGRTAVWRLRVVSSGAVSLNFGFTRYRMPPGGRLRLYAPDGAGSAGPFTSADNESHGELWTPLVPAGEVVIEVALPANLKDDLEWS